MSKKFKFWKAVSIAFNLGLSISLPIVGGGILGMVLDNKLNTRPRLTLSLLFAGVFVASGAVYNAIKQAKEE